MQDLCSRPPGRSYGLYKSYLRRSRCGAARAGGPHGRSRRGTGAGAGLPASGAGGRWVFAATLEQQREPFIKHRTSRIRLPLRTSLSRAWTYRARTIQRRSAQTQCTGAPPTAEAEATARSASQGYGVCPREARLRARCRRCKTPQPDQSTTADSHTTSCRKRKGAPTSRRVLLLPQHRPSPRSPRSQHLTRCAASSKRAALCAFKRMRPETAMRPSPSYAATSSTKHASHLQKSALTLRIERERGQIWEGEGHISQ